MKKILAMLLAGIVLAGCSSKSQLAYFADTEGVVEGTLTVQRPEVKIKPGDELLINVSSEIPEASVLYNLPLNNPAPSSDLTVNTATTRQQTYVVGDDGNIRMPLLGTVHVEGLTTRQLAQELTRRISQDVENPYVKVNIINFKVNVLGEVQDPGQKTFSSDWVTVMDALAQARDITIFGRKDNVTVIREEGDKLVYHKLDLTKKESMQDPYYYLQQNDVVLVEPGSARSGQAEFNQSNSFKLSVISTVVSAVSVITSLVIALAVK